MRIHLAAHLELQREQRSLERGRPLSLDAQGQEGAHELACITSGLEAPDRDAVIVSPTAGNQLPVRDARVVVSLVVVALAALIGGLLLGAPRPEPLALPVPVVPPKPLAEVVRPASPPRPPPRAATRRRPRAAQPTAVATVPPIVTPKPSLAEPPALVPEAPQQPVPAPPETPEAEPVPAPHVAPVAPEAELAARLDSPPPAPAEEPGGDDDSAAERIARAIAGAKRAAVRSCFEHELKDQLTGTVIVELDLAPPNRVDGLRVSDDLNRPTFTRCVTSAMQGVRFAALEEEISVRVPYVLSPERK